MSEVIPVKLRSLNGALRIKVRPIPYKLARDHGALCRAFGLDPVRTRFDLPESWGEAPSPGRSQDGLVFFNGEPFGTVHRMSDGEKIPDNDPTNPSDFFNLNNRI